MNLKQEVDKLSIEITRLGLGSNIEIDDKTGIVIVKVTTRDRQLERGFSFKVVPAWHDDIVEYALNIIKKHYREMILMSRITKKSEVVEGYIVKDMEESCSEFSCGELCEFNERDCEKCQLNKALNKLGEIEDREEAWEADSKKKMELLEEASKPLVEFVNKYCCPHDIIVVEQGHVSILNGEMHIPTGGVK